MQPEESDHIYWQMEPAHIDQSIFNANCVNIKLSALLCVYFSQSMFQWIAVCGVPLPARKYCVKERRINEAERIQRKKEKNKCIENVHSAINYLVISLQAANKFNQCKGLSALRTCDARIHVAGYFLDYMCSL